MRATIYVRGESEPVTGDLLVERYTDVAVATAEGQRREIPGWLVAGIERERRCEALDRALEALEGGAFDETIAALRAPDGEPAAEDLVLYAASDDDGVGAMARRAWYAPYKQLYLANALRIRAELRGDAASFTEAAEAFGAFRAEAPRHLMIPHAIFGQGLCLLRSGVSAYPVFESLAQGTDKGPIWPLMGVLGEGMHQMAACGGEDAEARFRAAERSGADLEWGGEVAQMALVERAARRLALGQAEEALALLAPVWEDVAWADATAMPRALTIVGDAFRTYGLEEGGVAAAVPAYLRVLRYFPARHPENAHALYHLVLCYREMGQAENAQLLEGALRERYPDSAMARRLG